MPVAKGRFLLKGSSTTEKNFILAVTIASCGGEPIILSRGPKEKTS